jgi:hypothetical protein
MTAAPAAIPESDDQMLARLAARDLAAAERVHDRLMAAEAVGEIAELGRTYQRFARSLRQTLALKAKLKQDGERAARDAAAAPPPVAPVSPAAAARRVREVTAAVLRVAWRTEPEAEAFDWHVDALTDLIAEERLKPDFGSEALDDDVLRLCLAMGLPADKVLAWRDLPEPPSEASSGPAAKSGGGAGPPWRSSA